MSLGGGGSGGGMPDQTALVQSEKDRLLDTQRRMDMYDSLFGDMERSLINEGLGILNTGRVDERTAKVDETTTKLNDIRDQIEADRAIIKQHTGADLPSYEEVYDGSAGSTSGAGYKSGGLGSGWNELSDGQKALGILAGGPAAGMWVGAFSGNRKRKKIKRKVNRAKARLEKNYALVPQLVSERTGHLSELEREITTQRSNSISEQTEQGHARASGTVTGSYNLTGELRQVRDSRYGIAEDNARSETEQAKELAMLEAAAEAGARNKAKTDVDSLFKAKLGALSLAGQDDQAAASQLRSISNQYTSQAAQQRDLAAQYGAQSDAFTAAMIGNIGSAAGTAAGTAYAYKNPKPSIDPFSAPQPRAEVYNASGIRIE